MRSFAEVPVIYSSVTDKEGIRSACAMAAKSRLAVAGWVFFDLFKQGKEGIENEYQIEKIAMAHSNITGDAVGVAVAFRAWGDLNAGCFVRSCHRRLGVGSSLVSSLLIGLEAGVRIHQGIAGSMSFWQACGANDFDYIAESRQQNLTGC